MSELDRLRALAAKDAPTFGDANQAEYLRGRLQRLVDAGSATPAEQAELSRLQQAAPENQQTIGETGAAYRGFQHDITAGQLDTLGGVKSFLQGDGYEAGRDAVRGKDQAALEAHPEAFGTGQIAGSGALGGVSLAAGAPALKGANWLTKMLAGAGVGGGIAYNQEVQQDQLEGNPPQSVGDFAKVGEENWPTIATGLTLGGAAYPIAAGAGATARGLGNLTQSPLPGMGRKSSHILRDVTDEALNSGQDIQQYLGGLADEAMLADIPEFRATGQGLASQGGEGGKALSRALRERQQSNKARITGELDVNIGQPDAAFDQRRANAAERSTVWGPEYDAALGSGERVGTDRIAQLLMDQQQDAAGASAAAMRRVGRDLGVQPGLIGPQAPVSAARAHNVRSNLSDDLSAAAQAGRGKFGAQVGPVLNELDAALDQVPGYAAARTGYANNKAMDDAIQFGVDAFSGGRSSAVSPAEFAQQFSAMSEPQKDAVRKGVRGQVARIMGTARNDAAAAWGEFAKDWNADKLRMVLGDEAEPIIKRLNSERAFSETHGAFNAGSQTDFRSAARDKLMPLQDPQTGQQLGPIRRAKVAAFEKPVNAIVDSLIYGPRSSQANLELGQALSAQSDSRDELVKSLMDQIKKRSRTNRAANKTSAVAEMLMRAIGPATTGALVQD
ncbi:MAG: hypothetical protein AB3N15_10540 [Paracoccaceae bacterium]